jgi:tetratricopeptide (TPR) repeat protein
VTGSDFESAFQGPVERVSQVVGDYHEHRDGLEPVEAEFPQFVAVPDQRPGFVGRTSELDHLGSARNEATVIAQVTTGLGGIGKTALAVEYCWRYRDQFEVVRWLNADNSATLRTDYLAIAPAIGVPVDGLHPTDAIARIRGWFETTQHSWLLVFDNTDNPNTLNGLLPVGGSGQTLITSRHQDWHNHTIDVLDLGVLPLEDAVTLLETRSGHTDPDGAQRLARELGCLALAVEQAAAFCQRLDWTYDRYLAKLITDAERVLDRNDANLNRRDATITAVIAGNINQATTETPAAADVLAVLAYFASENVPRTLLTAHTTNDTSSGLLDGLDDLDIDATLATLTRYSLTTRATTEAGHAGFSTHRVTLHIARNNDTCHQGLDCASRLLRNAYPVDPIDPTTWPACIALDPHLLALHHHLTTADSHYEEHSCLLDRYATHLQHSGQPTSAVGLFERAVAIQEAGGIDDDSTLLSRQHNLASSYASVGRYDEAISIQIQVVAGRHRILGSDHPETITARNYLATSYRSAGRYSDAVAVDEKVADDAERVHDPDHPHLLSARNNLAFSYWLVGRYDEAAAIGEQVIADKLKVLGPDHPYTITARNNLANVYESIGRHNEAIDIKTQVVADRRRILGPDHPDTFTALCHLAVSYRSVGRCDEAVAMLTQVIADRQRVLGSDHPDTIRANAELAESYRSVDRHDDAITTLTEAIADYERILGPDHPHAIKAHAYLANSYHSAGRHDEASTTLTEVAASYERILGPDHPDTIRAHEMLRAHR